MLRPWLAVMGATGTGKTKLALQLAQQLQAEIVNTDAMQVSHLEVTHIENDQTIQTITPQHIPLIYPISP